MKKNFDNVREDYGLGFPEKRHEHPTQATIRRHLPEKAIAAVPEKRVTDPLQMDKRDMDVSAAIVKMWYENLQK